MKTKQERGFQAFRRVLGWTGTQPALSATGDPSQPTTALAQHIAELGTLVADITTRAAIQVEQSRAALGATADANRWRKELLVHEMKPLATMAKTAIPDVVKVTEALRMPNKQLHAETLLATGEAMAKAAEANQAALVARGLPSDFITQFRRVAAAYKAALDARGQAIALRKGATQAILERVAQGHKLVETMSVIIVQQLRNDSPALAEWHQLRRVTQKATRSTSQTAPTVGETSSPAGPTASSVGPSSSPPGPATLSVGPATSPVGPATSSIGPATSPVVPVTSPPVPQPKAA